MKNSSILRSLSFAVAVTAAGALSAHAASPAESPENLKIVHPELPAKLTCTADIPEAQDGQTALKLTGLNTQAPRLEDMDAATESFELTPSSYRLIAHNGCDNFYEMVFFTHDLVRLKAGEIQSVRGLMSFFNASPARGTTALHCQ